MPDAKGTTGFVSFLAMVIVIALIAGALKEVPSIPGLGPSVIIVELGLVVVLAVATIITLLYIVAIGFAHYNLADRTQALALPDGSIRALIALFLIMLFVIIGLYIYQTTTSADPEAQRLASQLLTTVGTLVVAVAGFYFGTAAVTSAIAAVTTAAPLVITTASQLPPGVVDQDYTGLKFQAISGTVPYTWTVAANTTLPAGLSLNSTSGEILGKPQTAGSYSFLIQCEDAAHVAATKSFSLTVNP